MPTGRCFIPGRGRGAYRFPPAGAMLKEETHKGEIHKIDNNARMSSNGRKRFPRQGEAVGVRKARAAETAPASSSLPPAIPQRVARQQSPPPLPRLKPFWRLGERFVNRQLKRLPNPLDTASPFQRWLPTGAGRMPAVRARELRAASPLAVPPTLPHFVYRPVLLRA